MSQWKKIQIRLAEEFNLPLTTVVDETETYWRYIKKLLHTPTSDVIRVEGLGSFQTTPKRVFTELARLILVIRKGEAGLLTLKNLPSLLDDSRQSIKTLWNLKQTLGYRNTSKKKGPKELLNDLLNTQMNQDDED